MLSNPKQDKIIYSSNNLDIKLSKTLSYLTRHGFSKHNLNISPDGYIMLDSILQLDIIRKMNIDISDIFRVVKNCPKQRFKLKEIDNIIFIRANQGHSIEGVEEKQIYTSITNIESIPSYNISDKTYYCVHGTTLNNYNKIQKQGLKIMNRTHIHLSSNVKTPFMNTISGYRESSKVLIHINVEKAINDGIKFFLSSNNVILTKGFDGILPVKYFKKVEIFDENSKKYKQL